MSRQLVLLLSIVLVAFSNGCATKNLWRWARETRIEVVPAAAVEVGVRTPQQGRDDEVVVAEHRGELELAHVTIVPSSWESLSIVPGAKGAHLTEALAVEKRDGELLAELRPVSALAEISAPSAETSPAYAYRVERETEFVVLAWSGDREEWVALTTVATGTTYTVAPSPFQYAVAAAATPVTAAVDVVGVVGYVLLWPLWASTGVGFGDAGSGES